MPYRFNKLIGRSIAEVLTPTGNTIRVPLDPSSNIDGLSRGQVVSPTFNSCCQATGLVLPGVGSGVLKPFKDPPLPRRIGRQELELVSLVSNRLMTQAEVQWAVDNGFLTVGNTISLSFGDGLYLPITQPNIGMEIAEDGSFPVTTVKVSAGVMYGCFNGSFDQWDVNPLYKADPTMPIVPMEAFKILDLKADDTDYNGLVQQITQAVQTYYPTCELYTYRETGNRSLPDGRYEELITMWFDDPEQFDYTLIPPYVS